MSLLLELRDAITPLGPVGVVCLDAIVGTFALMVVDTPSIAELAAADWLPGVILCRSSASSAFPREVPPSPHDKDSSTQPNSREPGHMDPLRPTPRLT